MDNHRSYQDNHAFASAACSTLPASQYDARNVTGTRFFELGLTFDFPIPASFPVSAAQADSNRVSIPIQDQLQQFSFNHSQTFRILTVGIESYSIRRIWNTAADPNPANGFVETDREPVCIVCPQLQTNTKSRYFCMLPSDFGQGLSGGAQVSFIEGNFPNQLDFNVCLLNPIPTDETAYSVNQTRTVAPVWIAQYIRSLTLRLFIKATFEPAQIPVFGVNANSGLDHGGGMGLPHSQTMGGGLHQQGVGVSRLERRLKELDALALGGGVEALEDQSVGMLRLTHVQPSVEQADLEGESGMPHAAEGEEEVSLNQLIARTRGSKPRERADIISRLSREDLEALSKYRGAGRGRVPAIVHDARIMLSGQPARDIETESEREVSSN